MFEWLTCIAALYIFIYTFSRSKQLVPQPQLARPWVTSAVELPESFQWAWPGANRRLPGLKQGIPGWWYLFKAMLLRKVCYTLLKSLGTQNTQHWTKFRKMNTTCGPAWRWEHLDSNLLLSLLHFCCSTYSSTNLMQKGPTKHWCVPWNRISQRAPAPPPQKKKKGPRMSKAKGLIKTNSLTPSKKKTQERHYYNPQERQTVYIPFPFWANYAPTAYPPIAASSFSRLIFVEEPLSQSGQDLGSQQKWLWVKKKTPTNHRFWSIFPFTNRVFWVPFFDPQPNGQKQREERKQRICLLHW